MIRLFFSYMYTYTIIHAYVHAKIHAYVHVQGDVYSESTFTSHSSIFIGHSGFTDPEVCGFVKVFHVFLMLVVGSMSLVAL